MSKVLIIDGQIFQTSAWHRGMGRYLLALLASIQDTPRTYDRYVLLLNKNLALEPVRKKYLVGQLPYLEIISLGLPYLGDGVGFAAQRAQAGNRLDVLLEDEFGADAVEYLLTGIFTFDYSAAFPSRARKAILVFDLIPYLRWPEYRHLFPQTEYLGRFGLIYQAEQIFTISESVRHDIIEILGIAPQDVTSIDGAYIPYISGKPAHVNKESVGTKTVLLPTGDMPHKNNDRAVRAFNQFNRRQGGSWRLIITSSFTDDSRNHLTELADNVEFVGGVSDEELKRLYVEASVVFFPSEMEGLGLPVLEGVHYSKSIACSKLPVFEEISRTAFYFFNPTSIESMVLALVAAASSEGPHQGEYRQIQEKYTWQRSARLLLEGLEGVADKPVKAKPIGRVALVADGDIASMHAQFLYGLLSRDRQVDFFFAGNSPEEDGIFLALLPNSRSIRELTLRAYREYSEVIYVLSASETHPRLVEAAATLPGIAVLVGGPVEQSDNTQLNLVWVAVNAQLALYCPREHIAPLRRQLLIDVPVYELKDQVMESNYAMGIDSSRATSTVNQEVSANLRGSGAMGDRAALDSASKHLGTTIPKHYSTKYYR